MKGLMVPLLMLTMTGIVVGQQTNSNSFRSTAYRLGSQSSTQGAGNFSAPADPSDIKPFDLSVTDEQIKGIRNGGGLVSKIEPRDQKTGQLLSLGVINAITLIHEKNADRQLTLRKMYGKDAGDGKLEFELDEWALLDLENNKLSFDISEADRGRFSQVAFYYKPPASPANGTQQAGNGSPATDPNSNTGTSQFAFGRPKEDSFGFLPLPGPEPGDEDFVGPVMPSNNQQVAENNRLTNRNPNANTFTNPAVTNQGFGGNRATGWTIPQADPRKETLAEYQNRIALEKWKQEQIDGQLRQRELASIQQANEAKRNQLENARWPTKAQPELPSLTEQEIAERFAFLNRQNEIKAYEESLAAREAELAKQKKELEYQRFVDSRNFDSNDDIPRFTRPTGPVAGTNYQPAGPVMERPERLASNSMNYNFGGGLDPNGRTPSRHTNNTNSPIPTGAAPTGGVGKFVASIPGATDLDAIDAGMNKGNDALKKQTSDRRAEGFIYFMLLCSLGLNIYLVLISRGFYVRYNELADELRETFTATM